MYTDAGAAWSEPETVSFIDQDRELLFYRRERPGAERLLLVHGIGMGHRTFDRMAEELARDFDVTAVDLPGFGDAPEPECALSIEATADLLAEAIRDQRLSPIVAIGHSMGGQVVAELAVRHPELVSHAVLIAPSYNTAEPSVAQQFIRMLQDLAQGKSPRVMLRGVIEYVKTGPRWFLKKLGPMLEHRLDRCAPLIQQPALVVCGSRDRVTPPEWCLKIATLVPESTYRLIDGPGHEAMIEHGSKTGSIIREWLAAA